jgi:hypothetical protein
LSPLSVFLGVDVYGAVCSTGGAGLGVGSGLGFGVGLGVGVGVGLPLGVAGVPTTGVGDGATGVSFGMLGDSGAATPEPPVTGIPLEGIADTFTSFEVQRTC